MIGTPGGSTERPALFFTGPDEFRAWLEQHHDSATELWMGLYKRHVPDRGLTWRDAVPEALCFGWIDSLSQRIDDDTRRQRWTPRRPASSWSTVNIEHVERLTAEGRMHPAGVAAFERRRPERSGTYSYEGTAPVELPPELRRLLDDRPRAAAWYDGAPASYRRIVVGWLTSAKRETTWASRMATFLDDSEQGRLIKPQRYGDEPAWAARLRAALDMES